MPSLAQSLHPHDLGHLRILAEHWGIELTVPDTRTALPALVEAMLDPERVIEIHAALPAEAQQALADVSAHGGRLPWQQFSRSWGKVRAIGPGRRDRERPDRSPISSAETLWYRGFIARAFFEASSGLQEFAYIPDDLLPLIPTAPEKETQTGIPAGLPVLGRPAAPKERAHPRPADDRLLDHVCTLLASHRLGIAPEGQFPNVPPGLISFATTLLHTAGLLTPDNLPDPEAARSHLAAERGEALAALFHAWRESEKHNDLHHVPHLHPEGEWKNNPLATRRFLLDLLAALPEKTWWSLPAFLADLRRDFPDFQRPMGDYDSWFIRDARSGEFLRGFEHWDDVDGALIRYLITGPLHWLGLLDLAAPKEDAPPHAATAFRFSHRAAGLLGSADLSKFQKEEAPLHIRSNARIGVPVLAPRVVRYQIARFCHWEKATRHEYRYRLTPRSLEHARNQGLEIRHLQMLLARHGSSVPPNIVKALDRWAQRGTEARLQTVLVLRLGSPDALQALRKSRAARFLGDPLGPTTIIVRAGAGEKVLAALAEMGYLGEFVDQEQDICRDKK